MADLGEEVKFRLGQVRGHPVPLGGGQDAVLFSPDEGGGLGEAPEQGGDLFKGPDLKLPADLAQGQAAAELPVGRGIAGHRLRDQALPGGNRPGA